MPNLDCQLEYWDTRGPTTPLGHPVNFERLGQWVAPRDRILDYGCGYGRVLGMLHSRGFQNLVGVDPSAAMIATARQRFPVLTFDRLTSPPRVDLPDESVKGALLFNVLTSVPTDEGQRAIVRELSRLLRPGGLLYVSDVWLQEDVRSRECYDRDRGKYGRYGVFDSLEGLTMRHHDPTWITELLADYSVAAIDDIEVRGSSGEWTRAFQWFGFKRDHA